MSLVLDGINWADGEISHVVRALAVDAHDHASVIREMDLAEDAGTVTGEYYSDTRSQAAPALADWSQWPTNAWVRIVHEVPAANYSQTLFTGFVWDEGRGSETGGVVPAKPTLMSAVKALDVELLCTPHTVGEWLTMSDFFGRLMAEGAAGPRPWRRGTNFRDYRFSEPRTWGPDVSVLSCVNDLCDLAVCRLDVDPDGTLRLDGYVSPRERAPRCTIDANDPRGVVVEGSVTPGGDERQTPSRYLLWRSDSANGEETYGWGWADRAGNDPHGSWQRGYAVTKADSVSDSDGVTDFWSEARRRLAGTDAGTREWQVSTMFLPLSEGDVVDFAPLDAGPRRCLVKSCETNLGAMTCALTLKEV